MILTNGFMKSLEDFETEKVRQLGEMIGYGRMMQLAEQIWNKKTPGAAFSVGPCVYDLVPCPHPANGRDKNGHCNWCGNSGRVTHRVLKAISEKSQ